MESVQNEAPKQALQVVGFRGAIKEIFGQFTTTTFWRELTKTLVQEALAAFLMTLGGVLVYYGKEKRNSKLGPIVDAAINNGSTNSQRAFGNSYQPAPSYQPTPSYQPSTAFPQSSGDARFPGFGR